MSKFKNCFFQKIINENNFTYRNILAILGEIEFRNKKVLDAGCGNGNVSLYLAAKAGNITGIDKSQKKINKCRKKAKKLNYQHKAVFLRHELEKFNEGFTNKFDIIICLEVLEHIEQDLKTIKNLAKYLKRSGKIALSVPSKEAPLFKLGLTKRKDNKVGHLRRYTKESLTNILEDSFKVNKIVKREGMLRNSMFYLDIAKPVLKMANRYTFFSNLITSLDDLLAKILGSSQLIVVASKKCE